MSKFGYYINIIM